MVAASELPIDTNATAMDMAETIFGDGVTVVDASYSGDGRASGIFTEGDSVSPGATPSDSGVILSTGKAKDFTNSKGQANQDNNTSTNTKGVNNDPDLNAITGTNTYDAAILDIDFIPTGEVMTIQFTFSSEEYPEYSNSIYNDAIVIMINGQPVETSVGNGDTSVGNVNDTDNLNLYQDNTQDQFNTEMDGMTVTLTLTIPVNPDIVNSIRIAIADVGDSNYDSNLLIAADSVQTTLVAVEDEINVNPDGSRTVNVLDNDVNTTGGSLVVTQINGVAVSPGDTITLPTGQTVTLNADGTFNIVADSDEETVNFTYTIESSTGATDTGMVTVNSIPCFVAGTMILTPEGEKTIESLLPGDLVLTQDEGAQPLRWIGRRSVAAQGNMAPVCIEANTFGQHRRLMVSPQHRVLIRDSYAELWFGEEEVLVAAKDLVNDRTVSVVRGGMVDYVHILFDRHQVVFSEGLATESFLPGPQTTRSFERAIVEEICAIFPEIDPVSGRGYSPAARRTLRVHEAQVLIARGIAA